MKILILEDDKFRQKMFVEKFIGNEIEIVDTAEDCISLLNNNTYDILFLDHDLGGKQMVESGKNTGYEVAQWLVNNPNKIPNKIIIHSLNPIGRKNIKNLLRDRAIELPFAWKI